MPMFVFPQTDTENLFLFQFPDVLPASVLRTSSQKDDEEALTRTEVLIYYDLVSMIDSILRKN